MLPDLFYIVAFSLSIVASVANISLGFTIVITVAVSRQCHSVKNLLMCHTAAATSIYAILQLVSAGYGLREDWLEYQPACAFRAYFYLAVCIMVCGSYAVQAISRLFFAVLYKHKYLLNWNVHWFMIMANFFLAFLEPIAPLFIGRGYVLEVESRLCLVTTKVFYSSMLAVTGAYLIPLSIVTIIYGIIFNFARQSTRRVVAFIPSRTTNSIATSSNMPTPNIHREMKLMKNIAILVGILLCAGAPYLALVLWHVTVKKPLPEPLYLLTMINISIFFALKMIVLFLMNKEIKSVATEYLKKFVHI